VEGTPQGSSIYFMFEPRSYSMARKVQSDMIMNNLLHDFHLFDDPQAVLKDWKLRGYSHILIFTPAVDEEFTKAFNQISNHLQLEAEGGGYKLYSIKYQIQ
jgi:hypothetical protein